MSTSTSLEFPFTAVIGQANFKLALTLVAITPLIGGVLVAGPRGSAKSTLARALAPILPSKASNKTLPNETANFVTLPLGASEEALLGSLDLTKALQQQAVHFQPGLLSKAHSGILYVDEVNLLVDNLVDQLLDVAASGVNRVERDGISHEHAAQFILIGTMNADEGELRPQLQDRFGLMVALQNDYSLQERVDIVKQREAFDADPAAFCLQYEIQQTELKEKVLAAQAKLASVQCDDDIRLLIADRCQAAQVDGMRADIVWLRTAMAHAAWRGVTEVELADVEAVQELVLAHRRQTPPYASNRSTSHDSTPNDSNHSGGSGGSQGKNTQGGMSDTLSAGSHSANSHSPNSHLESTNTGSNEEWGSMPPQAQGVEKVSWRESVFNPAKKTEKQTIQTELAASKPRLNQQVGTHKQGNRPDKVQQSASADWHGTFVEAGRAGVWPPEKIQHKPAKTGPSVLHLILLDTSASTLTNALFAKAKGVILAIAQQAYLKREQIVLFTFGNDKVEQVVPQIRAPKDISGLLDNIQAGGGTPLRDALLQAKHWLDRFHKRAPACEHYNYILTDGRTQADVSDIHLHGTSQLIDTEIAPVKRGRGAAIAQALGANYTQLSV